MNDLELARKKFETCIGDFLLSIQTNRIVDHEAFREVDAQAKNLARLLRDKETVSKSLLNGLYTASKILRAEAPYLGGETSSVIKMADQLELIFDLILRGECPADRVPGVPRII